MGKKQEQDLRIVEGVVNAQLAERDAEIAQLKAELATVIRGHEAAVEIWRNRDNEQHAEIVALRNRANEADQIVRAGEAERKALAAQVAELQAWKDEIPAKAISRILTKHAPFDSEDADIVWKWLKPTR